MPRTLEQIARDFLNPKITVTPLPNRDTPDDAQGITLKFDYLGEPQALYVIVNNGWTEDDATIVEMRIMTAIQQHLFTKTVNAPKP